MRYGINGGNGKEKNKLTLLCILQQKKIYVNIKIKKRRTKNDKRYYKRPKDSFYEK